MGVSLYLFGAAVIAGHNKETPLYYFQERQFFTFFSALILAFTSLISIQISGLIRQMDQDGNFANFWNISAAGFFYLCLDEFFIIHEGMDRAILKGFGLNAQLYNFDGWILGMFGVLGFFVFWGCRKQVSQFPEFLRLFVTAVVFFGCMVLSDEFLDFSYPIQLSEEIFKILGVTFFLAAYMSVLDTLHQQLLGNRKDFNVSNERLSDEGKKTKRERLNC